MLHLSFELPQPKKRELNWESPALNREEISIIKKQIFRNARIIEDYVLRLDLLVNKEKYPNKELFIERIRQRLFVLMAENDTFRKVLWRHNKRKNPA